jgi:hypothetical protein
LRHRPFDAAEEVYPGYPGMVIREVEGRRVLQAKACGFPRKRISKKTNQPLKPSPTNNARDDKLLSFNPSNCGARRGASWRR